MSAADWMSGNLTTQRCRLSHAERRELWLGLRFSWQRLTTQETRS